MTHIITSLCLRDSGCVDVCPVECIVPGKPVDKWPWYYIDPDTCIDCGACIPECPYEAIFVEEEVTADYAAKVDRVSLIAMQANGRARANRKGNSRSGQEGIATLRYVP